MPYEGGEAQRADFAAQEELDLAGDDDTGGDDGAAPEPASERKAFPPLLHRRERARTDRLGRAATLICALEKLRQNDVETFGRWPFEIGLWVGRAATPNRMGRKGDGDSYSARARTIAFLNDDRKPSPLPIENCPWCGTKFTRNSFQLKPNPDHPTDLRVTCVNRRCEFRADNPLPILAVDEPIYRRLPCFLIATVDKFAALPWKGEVGALFGKVDVDARAGRPSAGSRVRRGAPSGSPALPFTTGDPCSGRSRTACPTTRPCP